MTALRRIATLTVAIALLALPTTALALDETDATTDRPAATDRPTDERPDLDEVKKRALEKIEAQLAALDRLASTIRSARHLNEDHAASLLRDVDAAVDGLTDLARKIEAASTRQELTELLRQIDDWKIAHVLAPKTALVIRSDASVAVGRTLESYAGTLGDVIARFEESGFDVAEAWRLLEDMKANTTEGLRLGDPVAESVIGLQASDWPDPAQKLIAQGRSDLADAHDSFVAARRDAKAIVAFLRALHDRVTDLATTTDAVDG